MDAPRRMVLHARSNRSEAALRDQKSPRYGEKQEIDLIKASERLEESLRQQRREDDERFLR